MSEILTYTEQCKNCLLCIPACPKDAITETEVLNKKGYKIIEVDREKCIYCGICYRMCPDYVFEIR
jgi:2-oxoglutarate ferredoxin oxidoreductase subunit delta